MNKLNALAVEMLQGKVDSAKIFAEKEGLTVLAHKYLDEASGMVELALYQGLVSPEVHAAYSAQIVVARNSISPANTRTKGDRS